MKKRYILIILFGLTAVLLWWNASALFVSAFNSMSGVPEWQPAVQPAESSSGETVSAAAGASRNCNEHNPLRNAYFGDLHIHTAYSMDARSRDMLGTASDAYRFARGEQAGLGPFVFDAASDDPQALAEPIPTRPRRLLRPLDFAAVTDHAEWIGEVNLCTLPGSAAFDVESCRYYRGEPGARAGNMLARLTGQRMIGLNGGGSRNKEICGADGVLCRDSLKSAWEVTQAATEAANDSSPECVFTAFHGWEYSDNSGMSKVHRNVIFRNDRVPELPVSSSETDSPVQLWEKLDRLCNENGSGCEAITIPHNPNVSNGQMFTVTYRNEAEAEQRRIASMRSRYEPIVEMMQIKGESECKPGMWNVFGKDEQCGFEKLRGLDESRPEDCELGSSSGAIAGLGCQSRLDFARYALIEGMYEQQRIGINPYRFGLVGGTDNHNAAPGDVSEIDYQGCCANTDVEPEKRLSQKRGFAGRGAVDRNPGGLMGVWAKQNTRDDLFDAMQQREVFATSGPRIMPRLFAGWELKEDICAGNIAEQAYAYGVPMGSELSRLEGSTQTSPLFVATAIADSGSANEPGNRLQKLQIIKVWHDEEGQFHQQVNDIASSGAKAVVNLDSCELEPAEAGKAAGKGEFCATWRDPEFSARSQAAYYLRVLETPSCRWSWRHCLAEPEGQRSAACSDDNVPKTIQERAWTSPIWIQGQAAVQGLLPPL